jgi:O-antigen/teichoic acid export membrane protein
VSAGDLIQRFRSPAGRRSSIAMADQGLSAATNFALSVIVARAVDADQFGAFGIAFAIYMITRGISTAMWATPVTIRHASTEADERIAQVTVSAGAALLTGVAVAVPMLLVAVAIGGTIGEALLPLSICMPGLLLQDAWRQGFITHAVPGKAAINDLVWAVLQISGVATVVVVVEDPTIAPMILAWGLSGSLAGLFATVQSGHWPRFLSVPQMMRDHRHLGPQFAGEFLASTGQGQVTLIALAAVSGTTATAGFRGAQVLFGPQRVLANGLILALLPEAARVRSSPHHLHWLVRALSTFNTAMAVALGGILLLLPASAGEAILGDSWAATRPVILPMTVLGVTGTLASGPSIGLRVIERASTCLRIQLLLSPLALVFALVGMVMGGAAGAAWGLAVAGAVGTLLWTRSWRIESRDHEAILDQRTDQSSPIGPTAGDADGGS